MIALEEARRIAYLWHGGGGSPLYSFASTSAEEARNITQATIGEVDENIEYAELSIEQYQHMNGEETPDELMQDQQDLHQLREFLVAHMPEPPLPADDTRYDSGGFEILNPVDEINEMLGHDADVSDSSQYCRECGMFVGSPGGPDYICRCG